MAATLGLGPVAPLPLSAGGRREVETSHFQGLAQDRRWDAVLLGMVEKGLGLGAISSILGLSSEEVLDRAVGLLVPAPHDRPMRRSAHPRAWPIADIRLMVECWLDRWDAGSIAALFQRSKGSIYALKRRLNLPGRARGDIKRPGTESFQRRQRIRGGARGAGSAEQLAIPVQPRPTDFLTGRGLTPTPQRTEPDVILVCSPPPALAALQRALMGEQLQLAPIPTAPPTRGAITIGLVQQPDGTVLRVERLAQRNEILWTPELELNIAFRVFAHQNYKAIAADLGISPAAVRTRISHLGLQTAARRDQVSHFDPARVVESILTSDQVLRRCPHPSFNGRFFFWCARKDMKSQHFSNYAASTRAYRKVRSASDCVLGI